MGAVPRVFLCFELVRHDQDRIDFIEGRSACPIVFDIEDGSQPDRVPRRPRAIARGVEEARSYQILYHIFWHGSENLLHNEG